MLFRLLFFFFFKQKTAYEMRISDWSSDVCSSDLPSATKIGCDNSKPAGELVRELLKVTRVAGQPVQAQNRRPIGRPGVIAVVQVEAVAEIGRESCRDRVCQYV